MRRLTVLAAILWAAAAADATAECTTKVTPSRSGSLVTIEIDFCPPTAAPQPTAAPAAAAAAASGPELYTQWSTLTAAPTAAAAAPATSRPDATTIGDAFSSVHNFLNGPETSELKGVRIDERDRVSIKLKHFNFVNFASEYTVEKTVIEAYVTLNTLWSQALGLGRPFMAATTGTGPCPAGETFERCVVDWMWSLILTSRVLNDATATHNGHVALSDAAIAADVTAPAARLQSLRAQLVQVQSDTLTRRPGSVQEIEWYNQVQAAHDKLIGQIDAYLRLAELTRTGQLKNIDRQQAGTLVTVRVTATNVVGNPAGKPVEVQYFVHSRYPVTFHAGYLYSSLKEVEFKQVRTTAQADLFQQVQDPSSINTYAAFLSYQLVSGHTGRFSTGILATLGTDFKDPGQRLYVGGSVRVLSRIFIGGGWLSASVAEGENAVVEQLGNQLGTRELFSAVTSRREWKPYFHISFGVFN